MALVQQQAIEFPFRTEDGGEIIDAPCHLLAALRRSTVSTDHPKGLVLLSGPSSVYRLGLCAAVDRALAGEPVLYLAGANVFDPFLVGRLARASRVAPAHVLRTYDARFVILAGPLDTLYDQSVPEAEVMRLFRAMTEALQHMIEQAVQVLCVTPLAPPESGGRSRFVAALRAQARRAIDLCEAEDGLWLQEEGGPEPKRWMIPRLLWNRL
ncbi:MAG: hypothetical protein HY038_08800 [Nitrospirae bacterium]|nr:hypothetical protein [Nitrospirota bacterium]